MKERLTVSMVETKTECHIVNNVALWIAWKKKEIDHHCSEALGANDALQRRKERFVDGNTTITTTSHNRCNYSSSLLWGLKIKTSSFRIPN